MPTGDTLCPWLTPPGTPFTPGSDSFINSLYNISQDQPLNLGVQLQIVSLLRCQLQAAPDWPATFSRSRLAFTAAH
jgi:hypothetical protein